MTLDEKEKEFDCINDAFRSMNLSLLSATLCGAGLVCVALSQYEVMCVIILLLAKHVTSVIPGVSTSTPELLVSEKIR